MPASASVMPAGPRKCKGARYTLAELALLLGKKEAWTSLPWPAMGGVADFLRGRGWVAIGSLYSTDSQPGSLDRYVKYTSLKGRLLAGSPLCWNAQESW